MAPSTVQECYSGIQLALDLAEKYQIPVIFLAAMGVLLNISRFNNQKGIADVKKA